MSRLIFTLIALLNYLNPVWANSSCFPQTECPEGLNSQNFASLNIMIQGQGTVSNSESSCETACTQKYSHGSTVTLMATPTTGYLFSQWEGDCQGMTHETTFLLEGEKTCIAQFIPRECQPTIYSSPQSKLDVSVFAVEMYFPLTDIPNGSYALCAGQGGEAVVLKYWSKEEAFLFLPPKEILCANQLVELPVHSSCPRYSSKHRVLEFPNLQVNSEVLFPGGKKLSPGKCYQANLTQGVKLPHGISGPEPMVNSRLFTLVHVEQSLCN